MIDKLIDLLLDRLHERFDLHPGRLDVSDGHAAHSVERLVLNSSTQIPPRQPFQNDTNCSIPQLDKLLEASDHTNRWKLLRLTILVSLDLTFGDKDQQYLLVFLPCPLHSTVGLTLPHLKRYCHVWHAHHLSQH